MAAKKLSFVTTGLSYGGAETQLVRLAVRLRQRGWQIEVASMLPPVAYVDVLEGQGITVHNLRMQRKIPDPRALIRLAAIVRRFRPSIVHAYMVHANLLARVCRLISPMPVLISSARNLTEGGLAREWAYRLTDPLSDLTTQVCRAGAERYIQRRLTPAHKMVYIPNGIETARFAPQPDMRARTRAALELGDAFTWLTIGRLEPQKDYPTLLQAFAQVVRRSDKPVQLLIVGQGAQREVVEQQIQHLGLHSQVRLLGARADTPALLNAADAFVLASAWEGMSNALLEAASTALPIVATDVGGNSEIVIHDQTGYLTPPRAPEALAAVMLHLMQLPEAERTAIGQAGRAHVVANFDIERIVDRWEQLYNQLLEQKGFTTSPK